MTSSLTGFIYNATTHETRFLIPCVNAGELIMKGFLDDSLRLVNFTAACGPAIYRGDLFGAVNEVSAGERNPLPGNLKMEKIGQIRLPRGLQRMIFRRIPGLKRF